MPNYSGVSIETQNLILSKAKRSDLDEIYNNLWRHEESTRFMLWEATKNIEDAKVRLEKTIAFQTSHKYAFFI